MAAVDPGLPGPAWRRELKEAATGPPALPGCSFSRHITGNAARPAAAEQDLVEGDLATPRWPRSAVSGRSRSVPGHDLAKALREEPTGLITSESSTGKDDSQSLPGRPYLWLGQPGCGSRRSGAGLSRAASRRPGYVHHRGRRRAIREITEDAGDPRPAETAARPVLPRTGERRAQPWKAWQGGRRLWRHQSGPRAESLPAPLRVCGSDMEKQRSQHQNLLDHRLGETRYRRST